MGGPPFPLAAAFRMLPLPHGFCGFPSGDGLNKPRFSSLGYSTLGQRHPISSIKQMADQTRWAKKTLWRRVNQRENGSGGTAAVGNVWCVRMVYEGKTG